MGGGGFPLWATQTSQLQPSFVEQAGAQAQLFGRQLFQGNHARGAEQNGESTKASSCPQADLIVGGHYHFYVHAVERWLISACHRQDFQFFPPKLAELQERELAVYKAWLYH